MRFIIERMKHCGDSRLYFYFFLPFTSSEHLIRRITYVLHLSHKAKKLQLIVLRTFLESINEDRSQLKKYAIALNIKLETLNAKIEEVFGYFRLQMSHDQFIDYMITLVPSLADEPLLRLSYAAYVWDEIFTNLLQEYHKRFFDKFKMTSVFFDNNSEELDSLYQTGAADDLGIA